MKTKVLFLSNIPTPYQCNFNKAAQKYFKFCSLFLWPGEKNNFQWQKLKENNEIKILGFRQSIFSYKKFYTIFNDLSPQVLMIGGYKLPLTFFALFLAKLKKCPVIFWLERPFVVGGLRKFIKQIHIRFVLSFADIVLAIGKDAENYYKKFNKRTFNFPYSMSLEKYFSIKRKAVGKKISFLYSGQLIERKNIKAMLEAFTAIKDDDIELNIVGGGSLSGLVEQHQRADKRIKFHGFVQPEKLPGFYAKNDIFLFPSRHDGWALVINEAMAAGLPVIGTKNVGAVKDYIVNLKNGYICGLESASIKAGINYYIKNKKKIRIHGSINRNIIKNSTGNVINSIEYLNEIIESIVNEK